MDNNKANNKADMNDKEIPIEKKFESLEVFDASQQQMDSYREGRGLLARPRLSQRCESTSDSLQSPLLDLPGEIRNIIYAKVIADLPDIVGHHYRPIGEFSLRQPALAKVNRQLRHEILPMFYFKKSFGVRIYPKTHSQTEQVWQSFLDRFAALKAGVGGISHLSHIRRIEVELWHPAFLLSEPIPRLYNKTDWFSLVMSNGIYLQFGLQGIIARRLGHRVGDDDTDWADRDAVRDVLQAAIAMSARNFPPHRLQRFRLTYPHERLVDLAMMVSAECKEVTGHVYLQTSFAYT